MNSANSKDEDILVKAKKDFETIQNRVYGEISLLLKYAKLNAYDILKAKNPSYSEVVESLKKYLEIVELLTPIIKTPQHVIDDLNLVLDHFSELAKGIEEENIEMICEAIAKLDCNIRL
ncbi:hypothetical protein A9G13_01560 [Gilliamella sp. wkB178]|uniref:hypothetical protein n=1 Tax=Gilliamella sp. wkB178 TaxID=3120259 RepID=UPI00080E3DFA|nr:hypothetical protein [Gilliamella apicola]OCG08775.1 hypothetical protein A9G13_01560 [Gilliamella apicola]